MYNNKKFRFIFVTSLFVSIVTFSAYYIVNSSNSIIPLLNYDSSSGLFQSSFESKLKNEVKFIQNLTTTPSTNTTTSKNLTISTTKPKIFCMILTVPKNFDSRTKIVNETWAKDCDKYYFITKMFNSSNTTIEFYDSEYNFPIIQPADMELEEYGKLTDKVYRSFKDIYLRHNNYDWYLKADDDTFVFVDNLRDFVSGYEPSRPITFGFDFKVLVPKGYHSGGAGYVLSKESLERLGSKLDTNYKYCPNSGVEDVDVGRCLRQLGVFPESSLDSMGRERFHPFDIGTHMFGGYPDWYYKYAKNPIKSGLDSCSDQSITFHYVSVDGIKKMYNLWSIYRKKRLQNTTYDKSKFKFSALLQQMIS